MSLFLNHFFLSCTSDTAYETNGYKDTKHLKERERERDKVSYAKGSELASIMANIIATTPEMREYTWKKSTVT